MKILFWGTSEFAIPSLRALKAEGHYIVGVVTRPDRPAGRGRQVRPSAMKIEASESSIRILEPEFPDSEDFVEEIRDLSPDISVVVAYGRILKRKVLEAPTEGSINLHASLLPRLRGAAPINWSIARGDRVSGVTVIRMVEKMDAGPIIFQIEEPIEPDETATNLGIRLSEIGAVALVKTLTLMEMGAIEERKQDESAVTYAPKLDRATARIDWSLPSTAIADIIRGMDALPGAWSELSGSPLKLFRPKIESEMIPEVSPGVVVAADPAMGLLVATGEGVIRIGEVQPPGKHRMDAGAWILGRGTSTGQRFE
ncbi:MAG: methionyl-tRNA formyltransferase [Gemmatimonadota bacterium]|nr:methionyl-tRNA formyltransferase [Gemmatimonadota bacterium]